MSAVPGPRPEPPTDPTRYLSTSIAVVCAHLDQEVSVSRARDEIRHAALRHGANLASPGTRSLATKLEHATGCTIEQLAAQAARWPASARPAQLGHSNGMGTELFRWWFIDETGERRLTTYKLSRINAARAYPDAWPDLQTREWRMA